MDEREADKLVSYVEDLIRAAVLEEREACAKVADEHVSESRIGENSPAVRAGIGIAARIRARG